LRIIVLVEGRTEKVLRQPLKNFLDERAVREGRDSIGLTFRPLDSLGLHQTRLRDQVTQNAQGKDVVCVVAVVDVRPRFSSAEEAKQFLRDTAGTQPKFRAHAAQIEFEAWLLPYWDDICRELTFRRQRPGGSPDQVNEQEPPHRHLSELFRAATKRRYNKVVDAQRILRGKDLTIAAEQCPEFKAFLNTLLTCAGLTPL
jgi:hypothetical protein